MLLNEKTIRKIIRKKILEKINVGSGVSMSFRNLKAGNKNSNSVEGEYVDKPPSKAPEGSELKNLDNFDLGNYSSKLSNAKALFEAAKAKGIKNKYFMLGLFRVCAKESGITPKEEVRYSKTSHARMKEIFKGPRGNISKDQWEKLKAHSKEAPFNYLYGGEVPDSLKSGWPSAALKSAEKMGRTLGNKDPGDGDKYLGRGFNQITGRKNYEVYGIADNPEVIGPNGDVNKAAEVTIAYLIRNIPRYSNYKSVSDFNKIPNGTTGTYLIADATCGKKGCTRGREHSLQSDRGGQVKLKS